MIEVVALIEPAAVGSEIEIAEIVHSREFLTVTAAVGGTEVVIAIMVRVVMTTSINSGSHSPIP